MRRATMACAMLILAAGSALGQGKSAVIVKQVSLTNQTAFIPPTVLVTPKQDALYRVSAYFEVLSSAGDRDDYYLHIGWTDASPTGIVEKTMVIRDYNAAQYSNEMTFIVSDIAGKPLAYSVTDLLGGVPAVEFNVYITVEQLQ